jgi:2-aminoadipate transaminase
MIQITNSNMAVTAIARDVPELAAWIRGRSRSALREMVSLASRADLISLAGGLPDPALFPTRDYARALAESLASDGAALQYRPSFEPLKRQVAELMAERGAPCHADQILLTTGAQQAITIAVSLLLERRGRVVVEDVTYAGLAEAIAPFRPEVLTVRTDLSSGMDVDAVARLAADGLRPAFVYAIPDGHNPCGVTMSLAKRRQLVNVARRHQIPIVEDDPYGLLSYGAAPLPPLRALDQDWVFYLGTFSKTIAPALRLGWMVLPADLVGRAQIVKEAGDLESSSLTQRAVSAYLDTGRFQAHIRALREVYRLRRDTLLKALETHFPPAARWTCPESGFFVWVELPPDIDCTTLLDAAIQEERVAFVPGEVFAMGAQRASNAMRLSFATCASDAIEEGVRRLSRLLARRIPRD